MTSTFGFSRALELMLEGKAVLLEMDVYFIHNGTIYRDSPALDDNENLLYGVGIEELKGFTSYEVLSDEWRELEEKL